MIKLGQYKKGIDNLDKSIKLCKDYPDAYYYKAIALNKLGKTSLALTSINKAIALNANNKNYQKMQNKIKLKRNI